MCCFVSFTGQAVVADRGGRVPDARNEPRKHPAIHRSREERSQHGDGAVAPD